MDGRVERASQEGANQYAIFVGGARALSGETPMVLQGLALIYTQYCLRVADVDREKHEFSLQPSPAVPFLAASYTFTTVTSPATTQVSSPCAPRNRSVPSSAIPLTTPCT